MAAMFQELDPIEDSRTDEIRPENREWEEGTEQIDPEEERGPYAFDWMHPGPLKSDIAATFIGGRYSPVEMGQDGWFFEDARVWGGSANVFGRNGTFISPTPQFGGVQSIIDLALRPEWGNTAENRACVYLAPGTTVYIGQTASQGGFSVGGGMQIYVPPPHP